MPNWTTVLLVFIPVLPLAGAAVAAALGPGVLRDKSHIPVVAGIGGSFLAAIMLLFAVRGGLPAADGHETDHGHSHAAIGYEHVAKLWTWAAVNDAYDQQTAEGVVGHDFRVEIALRADPLTAIMLSMVTFVSLLVAIYAIGYMHDDRGYWRFFSYIGLFVFSMTMLVSVSNFVLLYVFWEAVGLCSYLLIGFWYEKPEAAAAGKKAFLVNRIGDFGFALGLFLIWTTYGTLDFHDTVAADGTVLSAGVFGAQNLAKGSAAYVGGGIGTAICLLLMLGACGKSAQFPLHVWLPDAMEGPTPVSALIHAATMVTAGVYMVARCTPLFHASTDAQMAVAAIGGFTALMAALIALTQTDLKRILAYSTISQLGYMFLGLGAGSVLGITAGMFHLFTHAFFKALLFLGAGSVMHAMGGVIDIRRFGGLRKIMPVTHWTFLVGCATLAGVPFLSGFFSKDMILAAVEEQEGNLYHWLYIAASFTALLTAFYTFRAYFCTFFGPEEIPGEAGHHAHESPSTMTVPLIVLAVCSAVVGIYFEVTHGFAHFLQQTPSIAYLNVHGHEHAHEGMHLKIMLTSAVIALVGIGLGAIFYWPARRPIADGSRKAMEAIGFYRLSNQKFYFDEIYQVLFVWPLMGIAAASYWVDRNIIDRFVNFVGRMPPMLGAGLRPLQNGLVPFYAVGMVLGLLVLLVAALMGWGWMVS